MRNHRNGATLPGTPHFRRLSAFPSSLSPSLSPLAPCPLLSCALSPFLTFSPSHFLPSFSFIPCSKSPDLFFCLSLERIIQTSSDERGVMEIITCTLTRLASHIRIMGNIFRMRSRSAILAPPNWISITCWGAINVPRYIVKWQLRISVACWESSSEAENEATDHCEAEFPVGNS